MKIHSTKEETPTLVMRQSHGSKVPRRLVDVVRKINVVTASVQENKIPEKNYLQRNLTYTAHSDSSQKSAAAEAVAIVVHHTNNKAAHPLIAQGGLPSSNSWRRASGNVVSGCGARWRSE
jgi:hypothetical protein